MAFPVLLDTNVLFGAYLCDTVLRLAEAGTFRPLWSADILAELERNLVTRGVDPDRAARRVAFMSAAFPDAVLAQLSRSCVPRFADEVRRHL